MISRRALFGLSVGAVAAAKASVEPAAPMPLQIGNAGDAYQEAVRVMSANFPEEFKFCDRSIYYIPRNVEYISLREIEFPQGT